MKEIRNISRIVFFLPFSWMYVFMGAYREVVLEKEATFDEIPFNYLGNGLMWLMILVLLIVPQIT